MKLKATLLSALIALGAGTAALAGPIEDKPVGLSYGAVVGTMAFGSEVIYTRNNAFSVRAVHNGVRTSGNYELEGTDFDYDARISSAGVMVDYHPTGELFRVSAGVRRNMHFGADLSTTFDNSFDYGGQSYSESEETTVNGRVAIREIAPVATFGWRGQLNSRVNLNAEFGAMYIGTPDVTLEASGGAADGAQSAQFNAELENQRQNIEDTLGRFGIYPIAQIGISMHF